MQNSDNIFEYARKLGSTHNDLSSKGKINNFQKDINEYVRNIEKTYNLLNVFNELGIPINIPGEWLLDNMYIIQKEAISIRNDLDNIDYSMLPKIDNNLRINLLAEKLVNYTDGEVNTNNIRKFLYGYSKSKYIRLQELWIFPLMIKIEIIKSICKLSKQILYVHEQKYKVENIIERFVKLKTKEERKFNLRIKHNETSQINMPFIEYMAYKLKEFDKDGIEYIDIFDEEVLKLGTTVDEVVSRQHFDVVNRQISISNCILSLKNINNIDFSKEFENISEIDVILSKEKADIYSNMDYDTLNMYRKEICSISKRTGISERYICNRIIELCDNGDGKKSHCGYYIIGEGVYELLTTLNYNNKNIDTRKIKNQSLGIYLGSIISITSFVTIIFSIIISYNNTKIISAVSYILSVIVLLIPISQVVIYFTDKLLLKTSKPKILPSMDYEKVIPDSSKTFVIIPTILSSTKKVRELIDNLETYYLINKQENIFFALLGDCTEIDQEHIELDDELIKIGNEEIDKLNMKYKSNIPKFYFLYRNRIYNGKQEKYLGWERKRGLITQFNRFLLYGETGDFNTNNINRENVGDIKYVLTIDADTQVDINSISKLIGIISHPLNEPVLNKDRTCVIEGYGILQPRITNSIECANKNIFSKIYAGYGGFDIYTNAVSDIYQDMWLEGIFTGKGIYDLKVFSEILDKQIPDNTVLSHDLLEGSFLRCGLVTNVQFIDNYPSRYNNYIVRQNRWLRGDIQIVKWLKDGNSLSTLSKWKILDNIRRGLLDIFLYMFLIVGISILDINWYLVLGFIFLVYMFPSILDSIFNIKNIFKNRNKNYTKILGNLEGNIYKTIFEISFLPYKAINNIETFIKATYRIKISKKYLLEWLTAEEAERTMGSSLRTYINDMYISLLSGGILICLTLINSTQRENMFFSVFLSFIWVLSPFIAWYISKEKIEKEELEKYDKEFLTKVGFDTWKYFDIYLNIENNYLIPDNYQENRKDKVVDRTSSTNIGLSFIAIMSAFDFRFINKEKAYDLIINILNTIDKLDKYRGNLYNWYNVKTLKPLNDNISSVDNGNYIAYLYVLKSFCIENFKDENLIKRIDENIQMSDFSLLYDKEKNLFSIEYNVRTGELSKSYYDLLASESRILSYVAISKGDVPYKHWYSLSRNIVERKGYKGLLSWTGTSFEYFMPFELMRSYKYSLLDETYNFVTMNQMNYVKKRNIPWGISESAFNLYDMEYNYQYKAFGIPGLGLKRGLKDDLVISPYASILILPKFPKLVISNMRNLLKFDSYGIYGYYDSIDYTKERIDNNSFVPVKTFMAHHQGLILMSIDNALNKNIFQKRFRENPEIKAIDILLQEKVNNRNIISNNKEKIVTYTEKVETNENENYIYEKKIDDSERHIYNNVLSNNNYYITCDNSGNGYSKYNDIYINRYRYDSNNNGINVYIKDKENDRVINAMEKCETIFTSYNSVYSKKVSNIDIEVQINTLADYCGETRNLRISNMDLKDKYVDVFFYMEPTLTDINSDLSHRAYSNMFLEYVKTEHGLIVHRRKKHVEDKDIYLSSNIVCDTFDVGKIDFENDRYKFIGRNKNILTSNAIQKDIQLTNSTMSTIEPIVAYKLSMIIPKETTINIAYIQAITFDFNEANNILNEFSSFDKIKRNMQLTNSKSVIESKFYKYKTKEIEIYQQIIGKIINDKRYRVVYNANSKLQQDNLWKYGISGDKPIILIILNRKIEIIFLRQVIKMYKYIKSKYINVDLVILINSNETYYSEIYDEIISNINLEYIGYDINNNIYILKSNCIDDDTIKLLNKICVLKFNGINGILSNQIKQIESDVLNKEEKYIITQNEGEKLSLDKDEIFYDNDIGGFNKDNTREYKIILEKEYTTPTVWSNILANKKFGTIVNENGGGYTWYNNSSQNKITKWKNDQVIDIPSEYFLIEEDDIKYSITSSPYRIKNANYIVTHSMGYSIYETMYNNMYIKQTVFVPNNDNVKINIINIKNNSEHKRDIKLSYMLDMLIGNEITKKIYNIDKQNNCIILNEKYNIGMADKYVYCTGYIPNVDKTVDNFNIIVDTVKNLEISMKTSIEIAQNEEIKLVFMLGCEENKEDICTIISKYKSNFECQYKQVKEHWKDTTNILKVKTPVESMNILLNGWLIYQTISSRLNARSGYYQSSGAFGFRDQLQDVLSICLISPDIARNQIIYHAKHQYINGDVQHWWHDDTNAGLKSRYSDDMLWLVYVTLEYIKITGDKNILKEEIEYLDSDMLEENEKHRYEIPKITNEKDTIYNHIIKAIDLSIDYNNDNCLPNIGSGDWSDGLNNLYGQSVWLGFFLYDILNDFLQYIEDKEKRKIYLEKISELEKGLNDSWDGKWYKRAFSKNGECIGSNQNDECKIDSISQSWSVISNFNNEQRNEVAMESVDNILVDRDNKLIKLFSPPFNNTVLEPGYIKAYIPGIRENGGQYTHAAIWTIIAQCMLENGNLAEEYFRILNPIEHSRTNDACRKYKVEPYVISADIYSADGMIGRGGWTWYTGAASWMYKAGIEYILGFKKYENKLIIKPCINSKWKEYEIWYRYLNTNYHIKVKNDNEKQTGVKSVWLDNNKLEENIIELVDDNNNHEIEVEM